MLFLDQSQVLQVCPSDRLCNSERRLVWANPTTLPLRRLLEGPSYGKSTGDRLEQRCWHSALTGRSNADASCVGATPPHLDFDALSKSLRLLPLRRRRDQRDSHSDTLFVRPQGARGFWSRPQPRLLQHLVQSCGRAKGAHQHWVPSSRSFLLAKTALLT